MDLLKSYAHQVVSCHPEKGRDDLFAEVYDELCEKFKDWQPRVRDTWSPRLRLSTIGLNLRPFVHPG